MRASSGWPSSSRVTHELVELRVFAGMTMAECATHLGTSLRTAERDWRVASAWLRRELARSAESRSDT